MPCHRWDIPRGSTNYDDAFANELLSWFNHFDVFRLDDEILLELVRRARIKIIITEELVECPLLPWTTKQQYITERIEGWRRNYMPACAMNVVNGRGRRNCCLTCAMPVCGEKWGVVWLSRILIEVCCKMKTTKTQNVLQWHLPPKTMGPYPIIFLRQIAKPLQPSCPDTVSRTSLLDWLSHIESRSSSSKQLISLQLVNYPTLWLVWGLLVIDWHARCQSAAMEERKTDLLDDLIPSAPKKSLGARHPYQSAAMAISITCERVV